MDARIQIKMQMGIMHTGLLRMPMIGKNFSIFSGSSEQTVAVFLSCRFELPFLFRMRNCPENLRHRNEVLDTILG